MQFFSHPMPLGAKNRRPTPISISSSYECPPIDHQVSRIFQFSIDPIFEACVVYKPIKTMCVPSLEQTVLYQ